ncbi:unnamed protein product, partial [Didymodactylos carnosus]
MPKDYRRAYNIIDLLDEKNDDWISKSIYLAIDNKDVSKTKFVIKVIDLDKMTNFTKYIKEISWYGQLSHINLMSMRECFIIDSKLYFIKTYAQFGSCRDILHSNPFGIRENLIAIIMWQVVQALRYLKDKHIMHRSVATKNIYICDDGRVVLDHFCHCISMMSDGKLRRQIYDYDDNLKEEILYLAPEIIFQNTDGYNVKSDVYSLGVTACELANGTHSYANLDYTHILLIKAQGVQPYLLDQTQVSTEMLEQSDTQTEPFLNEIKKRRYSKDFHSFVACCVATCVNY